MSEINRNFLKEELNVDVDNYTEEELNELLNNLLLLTEEEINTKETEVNLLKEELYIMENY